MRVSALTIIHNRAHLFSDTIRSVLEQSYPVTEFIIIDDGSADGLKTLIDSFADSRIRYYYYDRIGIISKLRNIAIARSTGDFLAFIDSDDIWHRDKVKEHVAAMASQDAFMSFSDCQVFTEMGLAPSGICHKLYGQSVSVFNQITEHNLSIAFGTNLFFRKYFNEEQACFDERLHAGEHDFALRYSAAGKSIFIPKVLNYIRRHEGNTSRPGQITDLTSHLEYNRTLDKLRGADKLPNALYYKIKAENYCKAAGYYLNRKRYRKSAQYLMAAMRYNFKWYYVKLFLKSLGGLLRHVWG